MSPGLTRLIYVSDAAADARSLSAVAALLGQADPRNAATGVTGALALSDGRFLQLLEGPRTAVLALRSRLERDGRHTGMLVLSQGAIARPLFGRWPLIGPLMGSDIHALMQDIDAGRAAPDEIARRLFEVAISTEHPVTLH